MAALASEAVLFSTKLTMPRRRADLLSRPRLIDFLREQIDRHLFLLVAPAAYGKTSVLVDFVHQTKLPACYYRLDRSDRDLRTFLTYLIASFQRRFPRFGDRSRAVLAQSGNLQQDLPAVLGTIVGEVDEHVGEMALLILDDYHNVNDSQEIGQAVDLLMTYLPHQLRVVIGSRKIPRISLSRLVVQQDVVGISAKHLRFTGDEVAEFVKTGYGLTLTAHAAEVLTNSVQGWIAGVVLSMHGRVSMANVSLGGAAHPDEAENQVFEFLAGHVLADEEPDIREFLLGASVLDVMTPADCDRLLARGDSARVLAQLDNTGLFIDRLDADSPAYMFHDMFRRFLVDRLQREAPARFRALHRVAGDVKRARDLWLEAVDHYIQAGAIELSADLIEDVGDRIFERGAYRALEAVLARLPEDVIQQRPALARLWARTLNDLGEGVRAQPLFRLAHAEYVRRGEQHEAARTLARFSAALRTAGSPAEALVVAEDAIRLAPPTDAALIAEIRAQVGIMHGMLGDLDRAQTEFHTALEFAQAADDRYRIAFVHRNLFLVHLRKGNLTAAEHEMHRCIDLWRRLGNATQLADARANLVDIYYQRGQYEAGERLAREVVEEGERLGQTRIQSTAWLGLGDVLRDTGRLDEALVAYDEGISAAQRCHNDFLAIYGLGRIGLTAALRGDTRRAETSARLGWQQAQQRGIPFEIAIAESELGAVLLHVGDAEQARELLQRAAASLGKHGHSREAALAQLRLVRAAFETERYRLATMTMRRVAETALALGDDACLVAELARGRSFIRYMLHRKAGAAWLAGAAKRLPELVADAGSPLVVEAPIVPAHQIEVRCFGQLEVRVDGRTIGDRDWGGEKVRALFLFLATTDGGRERALIQRELWPDLPPANAHFAFQSTLTRLRRALYPECVVVEGTVYALDPEAARRSDVVEFRRALDAAAEYDARHPRRFELLAEAVERYRGTFLPELDAPWVLTERTTLEAWALRALRALAVYHRDGGRLDRAAHWYDRLATLEPYDEEVGYQLMRSLAASGDRLGARREYRRLRLRLRHELHVEPAERLTALYQYLARQRSGPLPD